MFPVLAIFPSFGLQNRQRTKDEGRKTKDEGRKTKDEGRRTKDEGRKENIMPEYIFWLRFV